MVVDDEGTQKITSHGKHGCYATTKKMREGYLFQKPWVCQAFISFTKLHNPKLHGSTMTKHDSNLSAPS